jgi:hypothetical protein
MDGVIVAYHNTVRLFGFQYIPLDDMDAHLFGGEGRGDLVFQKCVGLLEEVADEITRIFPEQVRSFPVCHHCRCLHLTTNVVTVYPMYVRNRRKNWLACVD